MATANPMNSIVFCLGMIIVSYASEPVGNVGVRNVESRKLEKINVNGVLDYSDPDEGHQDEDIKVDFPFSCGAFNLIYFGGFTQMEGVTINRVIKIAAQRGSMASTVRTKEGIELFLRGGAISKQELPSILEVAQSHSIIGELERAEFERLLPVPRVTLHNDKLVLILSEHRGIVFDGPNEVARALHRQWISRIEADYLLALADHEKSHEDAVKEYYEWYLQNVNSVVKRNDDPMMFEGCFSTAQAFDGWLEPRAIGESSLILCNSNVPELIDEGHGLLKLFGSIVLSEEHNVPKLIQDVEAGEYTSLEVAVAVEGALARGLMTEEEGRAVTRAVPLPHIEIGADGTLRLVRESVTFAFSNLGGVLRAPLTKRETESLLKFAANREWSWKGFGEIPESIEIDSLDLKDAFGIPEIDSDGLISVNRSSVRLIVSDSIKELVDAKLISKAEAIRIKALRKSANND